jgi:DNA modification methylase
MVNRLLLGDNLEILKMMERETVDLIYLDPPFFSNRNYEVVWGDEGEVRSFQDRWSGGMEHYIAWLKERVEEMHRILKPTGSIFLHCDWHADAYIRVEILDKIFGRGNFRNHIIWKRTNTPKGSQFENKQFGIATDSIFFYSKTSQYFFDDKVVRTKISEVQIAEKYPKTDEKGRYYEYPILRSPSKGNRPNLVYEYAGYTPPAYGWVVNQEKLKEIDERGDLGWRTNGQPFRKFRPYEDPGIIINNYWDDVLRIQSNSKESIGYPTQKPMVLLERIIKCASNEGDLVLDPFMGGGTTIAVADKLNRKWIGIDQSVQAVKVTELRLHQQTDLFTSIYANSYSLQLHKYDYDTLRNKDAFEFESWIIGQFGGTSNAKQRNDFGLDGKMSDNTPVQVKRSENVGRNVIDNFKSAAERYDKKLFDKNVRENRPVGYVIAFSFGKGAVEEAARLKIKENIIIQLVPVDTIVPVSKRPNIKIEVTELSRDASGIREIAFTATGESPSGIEFYSWDFDYDAGNGFKSSVIRDTDVKHQRPMKAGASHIAVKAVDNDGLESIEVIKLKVNGTVERQ